MIYRQWRGEKSLKIMETIPIVYTMYFLTDKVETVSVCRLFWVQKCDSILLVEKHRSNG